MELVNQRLRKAVVHFTNSWMERQKEGVKPHFKTDPRFRQHAEMQKASGQRELPVRTALNVKNRTDLQGPYGPRSPVSKLTPQIIILEGMVGLVQLWFGKGLEHEFG